MALEYEVRPEYRSLSLAQLLDTTVMCFEGVGDTQHDILNRYFGVTTVRQLANMPYFLWALGIQEMALQGGEVSATAVQALAEKESLKFAVRDTDRGKNPLELLNAAVNVLEGLTPGQNLALYDAFRVTNVIQLAHNRIMLEARVIEYLEKHPELVQAEAPADKGQIASILGADTFVPASGDEAQETLAGEKPEEGLRQMAGDLGDHLLGRIDALKDRAAERARDLSSHETHASGEELAEEVESARQATAGAGSGRLDSLRQIRERTEATRVQAVSARVEEAATGTPPEQPAAGAEGATTGGPPPTTIRPPIGEQEGIPAALEEEVAAAEEGLAEGAEAGEMAAEPPAEEPPSAAFKPWMAGAAAGAVVVIALVLWLVLAGEEPPPEQPVVVAPEPQPPQVVQPQQVVQPPPPPPEPEIPIRTIHTVIEGQSLWRISRRHYRNPLLWPEIYKVNDDQIEDPDLIYPKQRFKIPETK
jgi:nucleoid-associated protein YgaU